MTKQERAARTRRELMRAAATLFERSGFSRTTLSDICRLVGVSSGALHFHFENKAALAEAIEGEAATTLSRLAMGIRPEAAGSLQRLVDVSHALAAELRDNVVIRAGFRLNDDVSRCGDLRLRQQWQQHVQGLLTAAEAERSLARDVPLQQAVSVVTAATAGLDVLSRRDPEWLSRRSLSGLWALLLPRLADADVLDRLDPAGTRTLCRS
ncbi:ScbR family autoregulator-binding transcription factor [Streptomyces sp. SP18CS02]|uniref:ScbR family autoregulator-binding transcription factor n=1 Tax=Streptomyces sp. SP18CS02 TaxID=3002531 RepID=UPI002E75BA20|nr:ScbR family autoregulator-binding transcription factor [Streptomyces sp. SP18CS02]MEE1756579.1 ScbR family autoregulator-binding transcription factor [Streptomyces sp. SP18CS02]